MGLKDTRNNPLRSETGSEYLTRNKLPAKLSTPDLKWTGDLIKDKGYRRLQAAQDHTSWKSRKEQWTSNG
ncbi:hypothetical protein EVAR_13047_1 [Eumeta japonica]|uniref:Uncharacterized protein n=1 Tax=Eumeta variegata TaxID=151549 RepID=A0A4C1VI83_EUMVA|nr:hypothetical protein EVAR_13047_1 [Eumeta japonica]